MKSIEIPVKMVDTRPIATLNLNGSPVPLLVDSGAFYSLLTDAAAAQLGLRLRSLPDGFRISGYTGFLNAHYTRVESVQLAGATIPNVEFITGVNEIGGGAMGVIGRNFLSWFDTEYDLAHGMVRLLIPKGDCDETWLAYWAGADTPVNVVPLESNYRNRNDTEILVQVAINGHTVKALLDTGAPATAMRLSVAEDAGLAKSRMTPAGTTGGGGDGHARTWIAKADKFQMGDETVHYCQFAVDDSNWIDVDMLIGVDYFLSHRILVSRSQRKLYSTWNGGSVFGHIATAAEDAKQAESKDDAEIKPDDADALERRGAAYLSRGNLANALADLDRACALEPAQAGHRATRARIHRAMRHPDLAQHDLDEALRLAPNHVDARLDRAQLRAETGARDGATDDLAALDASLPKQASQRETMGVLYGMLSMPAQALRQWQLWLDAHPRDGNRSRVLNRRCWLRVTHDLDPDQALADCDEAVDDNPDESTYQDSLGWVRLQRGDLDRAMRAFDRAISLNARSPLSLYGRAVIHRRRGDSAAAEADIAQARALRPDIDAQIAGYHLVSR